MKCLIIYFSLTGNTKKIAHAIQTGITKLGEECDILKLKEVDVRDIGKYDLIGLGSPVHYFEPLNVTNFIKRMIPMEGKHLFVFCTHATRPQAFFPSILEALQPKGATVIGTRGWYGSHNDQQFPKPYPTDGHPDEIDLNEAEEFGKQMAENSRKIKAGKTELIPSLTVGREIGREIAEDLLKKYGVDTKAFPPGIDMDYREWKKEWQDFKSNAKLNTEKCTYPKCSLCVDNCPMEGIDLASSPPRFATPCMNCLFCEKICPEGAIEAEFEEPARIFSWRTKEIYDPILDRAEAEGRFRRLVPQDKVGWDTPFYKVYNKHPRWIIT